MERIEEFMKVAREAAREAGEMLRTNFHEGRKIHFKGMVDLVTNFDEDAQEMIYTRRVFNSPGGRGEDFGFRGK